MLDIKANVSYAHQTVCEWFDLESNEVEFSWGHKTKFVTSDPFKRVRIDQHKIILKSLDVQDNIWLIDAFRGFVYYYLPKKIESTFSRWNFATVVSLLLIPSTKISNSMKSRYQENWIEFRDHFKKKGNRFDYLRIYRVFSSYNRKQMLDLLSDFLFFYESKDDPNSLEYELNYYLFRKAETFYNEEDILFIEAALEHQTYSVSTLTDLLSISDSKAYRIRNRLFFQIRPYNLPIRSNIGLIRASLTNLNPKQIEEIKKSPYFENTESYQTSEMKMSKFRVPLSNVEEFVGSYFAKRNEISDLLLHLPEFGDVLVSPGMYDTEENKWQSVYETTENIISIDQNVSDCFKFEDIRCQLEQTDLLILKRLLQGATTDHLSVSLEISNQTVKQKISKLEDLNLFDSRVLWRKPNDLQTYAFMFDLSDMIEFDQYQLNTNVESVERLLKINKNDKLIDSSKLETVNKILEYSWPYLTRERCIYFSYEDTRQMKIVDLVRISGIEYDLHRLLETAPNASVLGVLKYESGTLVTIPEEKFVENTWQFEPDQILRVLKSKRG